MIDVAFILIWLFLQPILLLDIDLYIFHMKASPSDLFMVGWDLVWIVIFHCWFLYRASNSSLRLLRCAGFITVLVWFGFILEGSLIELHGYRDGGEMLLALPPVLLGFVGLISLVAYHLFGMFGHAHGRAATFLRKLGNYLSVQVIALPWIWFFDKLADIK